MRLPHVIRRGFTIIELFVVIGIFLFIVALLIPILGWIGARHRGTSCASNLRQIGLAMQLYADENHGQYPRTRFDEADEPTPVFFTQPEAANPFEPSGPAPNDVTAALWL